MSTTTTTLVSIDEIAQSMKKNSISKRPAVSWTFAPLVDVQRDGYCRLIAFEGRYEVCGSSSTTD